MTHLACLFLLFAADPADKATLDGISKQLNSKKQADRIAGLEAAAKLKESGAPLVKPVYSLLLEKNDEIAAAASDAYKAISPKSHAAALELRAKSNPKLQLGVIQSHGNNAADLAWVVHAILIQNLARPDPEVTEDGFKFLRSVNDISEAHWELVKKYAGLTLSPASDSVFHSALFLFRSSTARRAEYVNAIVAIPGTAWSNRVIGLVAQAGDALCDVLEGQHF